MPLELAAGPPDGDGGGRLPLVRVSLETRQGAEPARGVGRARRDVAERVHLEKDCRDVVQKKQENFSQLRDLIARKTRMAD